MSKAVYRDYDQEALEYQYGPRLAVPETDEILARWSANSDAYYAESDCVRDIAYGPRAEETLDFFKPATDAAPVLIFIHGGYWRALDKKDHAFLPKPFVDAGVLVASINYTLCPEVTIDEITRQTRAACAWVWRNAVSYGGDPDRVHIFGHSAGGHLTAAVATTDWPDYEPGLPKDLLKSATPISGLFDLQPLLLTSVNDDVHLDAESAVRNSPANSDPGYDMPMTVDAYSHRIGRTGRAHETGEALSLMVHDDESLVRRIEKLLRTKIERRRMPDFDYGGYSPARQSNEDRDGRGAGRPRPDSNGRGRDEYVTRRDVSASRGNGNEPRRNGRSAARPQNPDASPVAADSGRSVYRAAPSGSPNGASSNDAPSRRRPHRGKRYAPAGGRPQGQRPRSR